MKKLIVFSLLILCNCKINDETNAGHIKDNTKKVSMVAVGDNLIHYPIYESSYKDGKYDFLPIYQKITTYIKKFDLAFINQESILGGKELGLSSYPQFNSPYEVGDALVENGFNLISLANNHSLDKGESGIKNSVNYWKRKKVIYSGTEMDKSSMIKFFTKNKIKFAFVAYTYGTNGIIPPKGKEWMINLYSRNQAKEDIASIKDKVDVIIVSMHWGNEYHIMPNAGQMEEASYLSSLGVDIILGHHPHVLEPVDIIDSGEHKTYVCYSLGNFLSDQRGIDRLIGMAFSVDIMKKNEEIIINHLHARLIYNAKQNGHYRLLFFTDLNKNILPNYTRYFQEKEKIIKTMNTTIQVS